MEEEFKDAHSLLNFAESEGMFGALKDQIQKDFNRAHVNRNIPDQAGPGQLFTFLRENIYLLILERMPVFLNLMYAIDIPERKLRELEVGDTIELVDATVFLVLKRELKKVWYRTRNS